jgi:hypothetical protein
MRVLKLALGLLILLASPAGLVAQSVSVQGRVLASEEAPVGTPAAEIGLPGAHLFVLSRPQLGTVTNSRGEFALELPTELSADTLVVSFVGYQEKLVALANRPDQLSIQLEPDQKTDTEVEVTAQPLVAEEFSYEQLNPMDVYTNPAAKADPLLAVNTLPSATTLDESANVSFRGAPPGRTGIFLNEVPIYDAVRFSQLNGIGTFSIFNTAILQSVQVFPGNPPLEYGNATSGLVALRTTDEVPARATSTASVSLANLGLYHHRPLGKRQALTAFANYQPAIFIKALNPQALADIQDFSMVDAGLHYLKQLPRRSSLKIFAYGLSEGYDFYYRHPTWQGTFEQRKGRAFTVANWRRLLGNAELSLNGSLSVSDASYAYAATRTEVQQRDAFLSANYLYAAERWELKSGLSLNHRHQHYSGRQPLYEYAVGEAYPVWEGSGQTTIALPEAYAYGKYYLKPGWVVGGGLRKNLPVQEVPGFWSAQLNLHRQLGHRWQLTAGAGQYNQVEFSQTDGTAQALRSRQLTLEANYRYQGYQLQAAVFGGHFYQNDQTQTNYGAELSLSGQLTRSLSGTLSYNGVQSTDHLGQAGPYAIAYFVRANLSWEFLPYWSLNAVGLFRQGSLHPTVRSATYAENLGVYVPEYTTANPENRLPAYRNLDVSLSRIVALQEDLSLILFAAVNNVVNFKNVRAYTYDRTYTQRQAALFAQRSIYFGANINF